jgi:hypothetical protein
VPAPVMDARLKDEFRGGRSPDLRIVTRARRLPIAGATVTSAEARRRW